MTNFSNVVLYGSQVHTFFYSGIFSHKYFYTAISNICCIIYLQQNNFFYSLVTDIRSPTTISNKKSNTRTITFSFYIKDEKTQSRIYLKMSFFWVYTLSFRTAFNSFLCSKTIFDSLTHLPFLKQKDSISKNHSETFTFFLAD